jgi:hypothetical protein
MEANGYRNVLSLKMFGLGLPMMLKEYGMNYEKRHTKQGIQTNLSLKEESYGDWLPKCDEPTATNLSQTGNSRSLYSAFSRVNNPRFPTVCSPCITMKSINKKPKVNSVNS